MPDDNLADKVKTSSSTSSKTLLKVSEVFEFSLTITSLIGFEIMGASFAFEMQSPGSSAEPDLSLEDR